MQTNNESEWFVWEWELTSATKSLPAHPSQHRQAEIAVRWLAVVLQSPQVAAVFANVLKNVEYSCITYPHHCTAQHFHIQSII